LKERVEADDINFSQDAPPAFRMVVLKLRTGAVKTRYHCTGTKVPTWRRQMAFQAD
jgi:hypothetical protein